MESVLSMERQIDQAFSFYISNKLVFESLVSNARQVSSIMPFVGEELVKIYFGSRDDFAAILRSKTPGIEDKNTPDDANYSFLSILDNLIRIHKQTVVDQQIMRYYADEDIDDYLIRNNTLGLIPYVNGHHSITSNLDHAIEHAYKLANKQSVVIHPHENRRRIALLRNKSGSTKENIIIKIHGDIMSDSSERILTIKEYEKNYNKKSKYFQALKQWLQNYIVLFIGVNLFKDHYLFDLLKQTSDAASTHFAFVACGDDEEKKSEVYTKLEEIGVLPILYDESKPENLELLLHKFLIDINKVPLIEYGELGYKYSHQDLIGRDDQIHNLQLFIQQSNSFLWTVITGSKQSGRTKLVYDFSRRYASDWEWYIIEPDEIDAFLNEQEKIQNARKKQRNLLIVFDNFQWYNLENLDSLFFSKGCFNKYSMKVRFVFVVCDTDLRTFAKAITTSTSTRLLRKAKDSFYSKVRISTEALSSDDILAICYNYLYYTFDTLEPISALDSIFESIKDELRDFITELINNKAADILRLSILKTIQLKKRSAGEDYLQDSELAEFLFKQIIKSMTNGMDDSDNYDYEKRYDDFKSHVENVKVIKEYFYRKEESETEANIEEKKGLSIFDIFDKRELNVNKKVGEDGVRQSNGFNNGQRLPNDN